MSPKKRRTFVRVVAIFLAVLMALSVFFGILPMLIHADSSDVIRSRIDALESDAYEIAQRRAKLEQQIADSNYELLSTIQKKTQIDQKIEVARLEMQNANEQVQQYNLLIAAKQAELEEGLARQEEMNALYRTRVRSMEENGAVSYWSILFKANSFSDLLDRITMISEISSADRMMLAQMEQNNQQVAAVRAELEAQRAAMLDKTAVYEEKVKEMSESRAEEALLLEEIKREADEMSETARQMDAEEAAIREKIQQAEAEYEKAISSEEAERLSQENARTPAGASNPSQVSGMFISPLPLGSCWVTDSFGYRIHPIYGYYGMHAGVDLAANLGTPVYAIAGGSILVANWSEANGYYVTVGHGNGWSSVYCHLDSFCVRINQSVKQGDLLGYVGSTGWATGPHLHFEIHEGGAAVNPMNYISIN